jgi:hypothetical protein
MKNVYYDPAYANTVTELHKKLDELRLKYKDSPEFDRKYINLYENNK